MSEPTLAEELEALSQRDNYRILVVEPESWNGRVDHALCRKLVAEGFSVESVGHSDQVVKAAIDRHMILVNILADELEHKNFRGAVRFYEFTSRDEVYESVRAAHTRYIRVDELVNEDYKQAKVQIQLGMTATMLFYKALPEETKPLPIAVIGRALGGKAFFSDLLNISPRRKSPHKILRSFRNIIPAVRRDIQTAMEPYLAQHLKDYKQEITDLKMRTELMFKTLRDW